MFMGHLRAARKRKEEKMNQTKRREKEGEEKKNQRDREKGKRAGEMGSRSE